MNETDNVVIVLSKADAERVTGGLSDILCWSRGFIAARPDDPESHPMGIQEVRMIQNQIRRALNEQQ